MTVYPFNQVQFNIIFVLIYKLSANFKKKRKRKGIGATFSAFIFSRNFLVIFCDLLFSSAASGGPLQRNTWNPKALPFSTMGLQSKVPDIGGRR